MARPPYNAADLARRLVEHEASGSSDPAASAHAVDAVCRKLRDHLTDLLGSGGVVALMGRALNLAKREHPVLTGVTLGGVHDTCYVGLAEALAAATAEEAAAAGDSVLAHFLALLILLLGIELGLQPVRRLWPHLASSLTEVDE
jgi:hypothetical protein